MIKALKDYWAIYGSIIVISLVIVLRSIGSHSTEIISSVLSDKYDGGNFFYLPMSRISTECLIVPAGTIGIILIWVLLRLFKRNIGINYSTTYSILTMMILSIIAIVFTLFSGMGDPAFIQEHIATAQIRNTNYHLVGIHSLGGGGTEILIRCYTFNTNCKIDYVYKGNPRISSFNEIKLQITSSQNQANLAIVIGEEAVYTTK